MKSINNLLDELAEAIHSFKQNFSRGDDMYIYCPLYLQQIIIEEISKKIFIARVEPFRFMDVEMIEGYENALIIANSKKITNPDNIKHLRIDLK